MKEVNLTQEQKERLQTSYLLIDGNKIIPLGVFKSDVKLTKENFRVYRIFKEKLYELTVEDFEDRYHSFFGDEAFNITGIAHLYHVQKRNVPREVKEFLEEIIEERKAAEEQ